MLPALQRDFSHYTLELEQPVKQAAE
jgi:hypothetical protein